MFAYSRTLADYNKLVDKFQFTFEDPQTPWFEQNYGVVFQKNMWVRDAGKV